ncbi:MAG: hypothetical protein R3E83_25385 [Burkholderiaceae bacterium]
MANQRRAAVVSVLAATVWIIVSEFVRNELLFKSYWSAHYLGLGLQFPSGPVNGAVWGLWSLLLAAAIAIIARRFTLLQTTLLAWLMAFVMMWVVIWNMNVLPHGLLVFAVPLSLLEVFVAAWLVRRFGGAGDAR